MSAITIGGIISGLDTNSIIEKLVAVESNSQTLLTNEQNSQKSAVSAYSTLLTAVGALATQVGTLGDTSSWATTTATSSSTSVTATATGNTATSLTFSVGSLAAAHTLISDGTYASLSDAVATGSQSLTLTTDGGSSTSIDVGSGSLQDVVAGINNANVGLNATAVQTAPGQYRLQVAAVATGAASSFTLDGFDSGTTMDVLANGTDASITVGSGTYAYPVTSSSNTFANVVKGLSFTVNQVTPDGQSVTVGSTVDPTAVATQISSIVSNANNLLSSIATQTAWDPTTKTGGPLLGDSTVRSLQQSLLSIVSSMGAPGLSVTQDGQLAFDSDAFKTAFLANPTAVVQAYGGSSSFSPSTAVSGAAGASYLNAALTTVAGNYPITVTANGKREQWQAVPPGTGIVGRMISLTRGNTTVDYSIQDSDTTANIAAAFNTKLAQAGMGVSATVDGSGNIVLTSANAGVAASFTASVSGGDGSGSATETTAGSDIQGTIDGVAATGVGDILTLPVSASSGAAGLSVAVNVSDSDIAASGGAIGSITYKPGLAQSLGTLFNQMSDSSTGQLVTAQASATAQVKDLQDQIDSWTTRLADYKANLVSKFTAMETALASLKTQSTALSQYFGSSSSSSTSSGSSSSSS